MFPIKTGNTKYHNNKTEYDKMKQKTKAKQQNLNKTKSSPTGIPADLRAIGHTPVDPAIRRNTASRWPAKTYQIFGIRRAGSSARVLVRHIEKFDTILVYGSRWWRDGKEGPRFLLAGETSSFGCLTLGLSLVRSSCCSVSSYSCS